MMFEQRTIKEAVGFDGLGLHSGKPVRLRVLPSASGSGISFVRLDQNSLVIPVRREHLQASRLSTTLSRNGIQVGTVEHLLAALSGLGIDNARVEMDGPEVPILDGSARPFVESFLEAGLVRQRDTRRYLAVRRPLFVADGDKHLAIFPANDFRITYAIQFSHPAIGYQERDFRVGGPSFAEEIAPARTFCLYRDVEEMRRQGLALGGGIDNAVVVGEEGILTGALRFQDEFVRHKILDLMGDLSLLGHPLRGHVIAFKAGHRLHAALVTRILHSPDAWSLGRGQDALPRQLIQRFERQKEAVRPLQPVTV